VLVDRLWPRGVKKENAHVDQWMREIAPSEALRKWFGHMPERRPEFQRRYRAELTKKKELMTELMQAEKMHGTLTLVFGAKDKERNQAIKNKNDERDWPASAGGRDNPLPEMSTAGAVSRESSARKTAGIS
jgi:uncharacterized protein YeaO (DUF488 family)